MPALDKRITITAGADKTYKLFVTDEDGEPFDLTGTVLRLNVKNKYTDIVSLIEKVSTSLSQIEILDQTVPEEKGYAKIYFVPEDTIELKIKQYVYDVWITLTDNTSKPIVRLSVFEVQPAVTVIP